MNQGTDRLVINFIIGSIVVVGVSSSVSPTIDAFYSAVAPWVFGAFAVIGVIWGLCQLPDAKLAWEVRDAWRQNEAAVRELAAKHAAHPEVAKELAERMLAEKLREQEAQRQGLHVVPPPSTPPAV